MHHLSRRSTVVGFGLGVAGAFAGVVSTNAAPSSRPAQVPYVSPGTSPYAVSPHFVSPRFGRYWYDALQKKARPTAAVVGDSIAKKFNASSIANSWVGKVRANLQSQYGDGGSGFMGMADYGTPGGTWLSSYWTQYPDTDRLKSNSTTWTLSTNANWQYDGPGFTMASSSTAGTNMEWNGMRGTTIAIYILGLAATTGGGTYTISVDGKQVGGIFTTINKGANAPYRQVITTSATTAPHKIVLTIRSGGVNLFGASAENSAGILVNTFARGGLRSNDTVAGVNHGGKWNGGASYPCDLLIMALGVNDMANADSVASVTGDAQRKLISVARNGGSRADILFVCHHPGNRDYKYNYHDIIARQRELAYAFDGALINMWTTYGNTYAEAAAMNYWGSTTTVGISGSDGLHPSDAGHLLIANEVIPIVNPN